MPIFLDLLRFLQVNWGFVHNRNEAHFMVKYEVMFAIIPTILVVVGGSATHHNTQARSW